MSENSLSSNQKTDDKFQALLNNANAARVISQAVEGTIGPKGLDIMMVDRFGDVVITNDGVTILKLMEVNHPAARMIINTARAQQIEVGDGTTTATIIAGALVAEGCGQILKGVPVTRIIEGIEKGISAAIQLIKKQTRHITTVDDARLINVASIAGRGRKDLAQLVVEGARAVGCEKLLSLDYKFFDAVIAREAAESQVFSGVLINKEPVNKQMPIILDNPKILVIDDALAPEEVSHDAMKTEGGFQYYLKAKKAYEENLQKICNMGINLVVVDRGIDDMAEEVFTEAGIMALHRVSSREIERLCKHTGAKKIKRNSLNRDPKVIESYLGTARLIKVDEHLQYTLVYDGQGENWATVIIGAATEEVVDEKERMAKDAASSVQAALQGGIVPGGGALEVWLAAQLEDLARNLEGMSSYGVLCVKEAILRPFCCMAANAGFNPLEKLGDVTAIQLRNATDSITFDCEQGRLVDVQDEGIYDPALVKINAVQAAGEVAIAILRINTVIRMKDEESNSAQVDLIE